MNSRPATADDYDAMLALVVADEEHFREQPSQLTVADLRVWLSRVALETDSWLYERDGRLCAFGWCDFVPGNATAVEDVRGLVEHSLGQPEPRPLALVRNP